MLENKLSWMGYVGVLVSGWVGVGLRVSGWRKVKLRLTQPQVELEAWAELGKNEFKENHLVKALHIKTPVSTLHNVSGQPF